MTKASKPKGFDNLKDPERYLVAGPRGATHQTAEGPERLGSRRFRHLKVIGYTPAAQPLFVKASIADDLDEGVIELDTRASAGQYIAAAKQQLMWAREARLARATHDRD
jgi:catalase